MSRGADIKRQAHELIDQLPEDATWQDMAYQIAVRASIERGLDDAEAGQTLSTEELGRSLD
jgi:predicted transcriptional regulator